MKLLKKYIDYELYEFESQSELKEYVEMSQSILINTKGEDKSKFYGIATKNKDSTFIGIFGGGHGIEPSALRVEMDKCILINIEEKVYCIDLNSNGILWFKEFNSMVYELIKVSQSTLLVICELGVVSLNNDGVKKWEHTSDVVTDFEIKGINYF